MHLILFSLMLCTVEVNAGIARSLQPETLSYQDRIPAWRRWDLALTSTKNYSDPYKDLAVFVEFSSPGNRSFIVYGFYEAGAVFRIRTAFPRAGNWTWRTTCSDTTNKGLHNRSGIVKVIPYHGANPLYRKGFLAVSENKRFLSYGDGAPFLWMGDTGWLAPCNATMDEWRQYIDDRAAKGFTVIQIHATQYGAPAVNRNGDSPFTNDSPDNAYWEALDNKIQYANEKGIVILLVGLGASGKGGYIPDMNSRKFAQYLTGRLAANYVIFSPSMDAPYDKRNDELGIYLNEATSRHLITQHVGTDLKAAEEYRSKSYLDFTAMQSGHHGGRTGEAYEAARNWSLVLWKTKYIKPVINAEGMYDGRGNNNGINWREQDVRKVGWLNWLSGALGYTYGGGETDRHVSGGHGGLWMFNTDSSKYDYWKKALDWKSASQMTYLKQFFEKVQWWRLQPAGDLIKNQSSDSLKKMAFAKSISGDFGIAYLPDNDSVQLDLSIFRAAVRSQWFNPVNNNYLPVSDEIPNKGIKTFSRPAANGDWVLLIKTG